jgi:alpha-amylase
MVALCFYFQVHQPFRIKEYKIFDIGSEENYFNDELNHEIMRKVAQKCYLPMNNLLLDLIKEHKGNFKIAFSISGVAIEQMEKYAPDVLASFKELADTGCVEFLSETYYHSLSFLYSKDEFRRQVEMHREKVLEHFNCVPQVFRNTELIYNNELANYIEGMGYKGIIAEGWEKYLDWRSPNFVYHPKTTTGNLSLLLKNYKLSDDIAFRFSNQEWGDFPLTTEKFSKWINDINGSGEVVNLFMDYETFGEHQWEESGIFDFMRHLPKEIFKHSDNSFMTPSEVIEKFDKKDEVDIHEFLSWADSERNLSAWLGNKMQDETAYEIFNLESDVLATKDEKLIDDWRKMTTSDHFYYMCTKFWDDGDVHKYFSCYESPYDAYIYFMNALRDLEKRLEAFKLK